MDTESELITDLENENIRLAGEIDRLNEELEKMRMRLLVHLGKERQ